MNQTYPFYLKLSCILISIVILGFLAIIGEQIFVPMILGLLVAILLTPLSVLWKKIEISEKFVFYCCKSFGLAIIGGVIYGISMQVAKLSNDWPQFQKQFIT
jgi:predicted PurR-regulated permease PerM